MKNPGATWYERDERYADRNRDPILDPNEKHLGVIDFFGKKHGQRVLDVGCGVGNFLAPAARAGWETWGIDFDNDAIVAGKRAFGLDNLETADLSAFAANHLGLRFDLVTFFDVLEHLDDHASFMTELDRLLVSNGAIALSVPYRHGWRWLMPHDLPPRHLTRWDENSIRIFLGRYGFSLIELKRLPASLYFITLKLKFRYGRWSSLGLVRKVKEAQQEGVSGVTPRKVSARVRLVQVLAKTKDLLLFGLPATLLWIALYPTRRRYTDFYVIAEKSLSSPANEDQA